MTGSYHTARGGSIADLAEEEATELPGQGHCLLLAILFATVAVRPGAASKFVVFLLALIPAATAVFVYTFLGSFIGGHVLLTAAIAAGVAALFKR